MKIGIVGCAGRMGRMLVTAVAETEGVSLAGATERSGSDAVGRDVGEFLGRDPLGCMIEADPLRLFELSDAVIDFTTPAASVEHAGFAAETRTALVLGTTGLSEEDEAAIRGAASRTAIVCAPNFSVGVNLLMILAEQAAAVLDQTYDIEIVEMHHRHKIDAPSGTALGLGRAVARGRDVALDQVWCKSRDGQVGARPKGEIGFATLRGGDVIGDHTVLFAGDGERIELGHRASSRAVFANGAVRAARWAAGRPPGLYSMRDVLAL
jgi:4-hydroxy-tetrahydrodipicolinate reductase